jgi:protoheme IX farnesyltransferase
MLPNTASSQVWTLTVLLHVVALVAISLLPLWYGQGLVYGLGAGIGGAYFLWAAFKLYLHPGKQTAMASFFASLIQLTLLIAGVALDPLTRGLG